MSRSMTLLLMLCLVTPPALASRVILVLGDSLSTGFGLTHQAGWTDLLQQRLRQHELDYQVVNVSQDGATTLDGLNTLRQVLPAHRPYLCIVVLGGNDALKQVKLTTIEANLKRILTQARAGGSKVLLVGVRLPKSYQLPYHRRFPGLYPKLARNQGVPLVSHKKFTFIDDPGYFQADRIHPNGLAQPIIFEAIWPSLQLQL